MSNEETSLFLLDLLALIALLHRGTLNESNAKAKLFWHIHIKKLTGTSVALDNKNGFERFWFIICFTIILEAGSPSRSSS